jgi:hypothetical protein
MCDNGQLTTQKSKNRTESYTTTESPEIPLEREKYCLLASSKDKSPTKLHPKIAVRDDINPPYQPEMTLAQDIRQVVSYL